jgi:Rho-binding antiterminator
MSDYQPIACVAHERLEFAVLKRQRLHLRYLDESLAVRQADILPLDVYTRDGAEWLTWRDGTGVEGVVRLDRILSSEAVQPG